MNNLDIGLILAISGSVAGLIAWYRNYTRTTYAKERSLEHIFKALEQQSSNILKIFSDIEADMSALNKSLHEVSDRIQRLEMIMTCAQKKGVQNG